MIAQNQGVCQFVSRELSRRPLKGEFSDSAKTAEKPTRGPLASLGSAELAAIAGVNEPDHAQLVTRAGWFAEGFPFPDPLLLHLEIVRFLGGVTRLGLILDTYGSAGC
jgi:hypothetical protein